MTNPHDARYRTEGFYWGQRPSAACYDVLRLLPPNRPLKLLDVGCGEGRNSILFARNGYTVTAFDLSAVGVEKTKAWAAQLNLAVHAFAADLTSFRLETSYDILFSTGSLHYLEPERRAPVFANYKSFTRPGGLHAFSVFVEKPFVPPAPDAEPSAHLWRSGELMAHYHEWQIESCVEEIFDCTSSGVPHQHAVNRVIARKPVS